ncbi:site-specific integrase [Bradyrhizobium sp. LB12.1]|uniref:tyrosine-type recombinase/integrase n=1 Tax=Bradyrhizobium sp. LB12.1 TaxID=3156327 RepID=UPI0033947DD4
MEFWEGRTVADISRETCRRFEQQRGRSAGTVRRELGVLRASINHAFREGRLTRTVSVRLPERPEGRDRWLTQAEALALYKASMKEPRVRLHLPLFILIGLYTGQRKEAILSLRWAQVDLRAGLIDFNTPGARRTNKRRAHLPVPPTLHRRLRRARERGTELGFVVHENSQRLKDIKRGFNSACIRAGLANVTPHTLRHTCATWLMQRGVSIWEASGYLGMSRETLERVYGHHHPEFLQNAAKALN